MNPPASLTAHRLNVGSLRFDIFSQILLSIFTGEYQAGTRLKVQHLAKQYGVSSTPVREAIVELTGIGVVELIPNRGAVVAPFGIPEIREIYHVRRILEVEAVRCACDCIDLHEIEQLLKDTKALQQASRDENWGVRCSDLDKRTHIAIANAAGNTRLKAELDRYDRLMHIIRVLVNDWEPFLDQIHSEHIDVLEAIIRRDKDAAGEAMSRHLKATCERAIEGVFLHGLPEA
ncbi:putative HTH-type transcriptional regulator YdfH [Gimesia alba]|uniref:Putative HTH-type transcriptional regulator YdfH n=1 Tax=Gimesia alba TaxID=2527973 RepID=A0A517RJM8_9PLAN|nr:GntR family transcriptional regulator [Gimesia alba]QDT44081.1 putative HTH-type transcriptional regulator YdfH [Gimesia alba]